MDRAEAGAGSVRFLRAGKTVELPPGATLLDAAEEAEPASVRGPRLDEGSSMPDPAGGNRPGSG
jgi:hypothetical protein